MNSRKWDPTKIAYYGIMRGLGVNVKNKMKMTKRKRKEWLKMKGILIKNKNEVSMIRVVPCAGVT